MPGTLVVELHRVGDVETGRWCPLCFLPSAVAVPYALVDARTLKVSGHITASFCTSCGAPVPKESP